MVDLLVVDLVTNHQDNQEEVLHNQVPLVGGAGGTNYGSGGGDGGNSGPPNENGGGGGGAGGARRSVWQPWVQRWSWWKRTSIPRIPGPVLSPAIPSTNVSTIGPTGLFAGGGAGGFNGTPTISGSPGGGSGTAYYLASPTFANPATGYGSGRGGGQYGINPTQQECQKDLLVLL